MLKHNMDIHLIRQDPEFVRDNEKKRFKDPAIVDTILDFDDKWRNMKWSADNLRKLKNKLSQKFKGAPEVPTLYWDEVYTLDKLMADLLDGKVTGDGFNREQLKVISKYVSDKIDEFDQQIINVLKQRDDLIYELGNKLHTKCVIDESEDNNGLVYKHENNGPLVYEMSKRFDHIDLLEKLGFVDTENGIKVAGNRGYFLTGFGVRLNQALINYALDFLEKRGYKLMDTPHFVTGELMSQITQLSDYQETLYKLEGYDKYLIATSEQPLTALFYGRVLHNEQLPIKLGGLSSCYRKEAGAHARHTRGIYRVHQFQKVEQFCVTEPEKSWEMFDEMIQTSIDFYKSLGLTFRVVNIVSGALNNAASMKYDLEAYYPGSNEWCELVSCTNVLEYFSRRLGLKGAKQEYLHMLNCTLCANTRTLCALVETYQEKDGMFIPEVLRPYLGNDRDKVPFVK